VETWAPDYVNLTSVRAAALTDATSSWRFYMDVRQPAARSAMLAVSIVAVSMSGLNDV
jgi:ABC-type glycerol-3-phosphate transport system permease component